MPLKETLVTVMYMYMHVPGELHISKECVYVVVENVQEVGGELEGGAEHDHHIGKSHLVH